MVRVGLGDDYYLSAYFRTEDTHLDYEIPRSQLERWEKAMADYGQMQDEIGQVMQEQRDQALAPAMERRKGRPSIVPEAVRAAYEQAIGQMLQRGPLAREEQPE